MRELFRITAIVCICIVTICACQRKNLRTSVDTSGSLELHIGTQAMISKAGELAAQGDKFNNIRGWLVKDDGTIVGRGSNVDGATIDPADGPIVIDPSGTTATANIPSLASGIYIMYVLANAPAVLDWDLYTVGTSIDDNFKNALIELDAAHIEPTFSESEGMPLSLVQKVTIMSGTNVLNGKLSRVCARLVVRCSNKTISSENLALCVSRISFTARNPRSTFVFTDGLRLPPAYAQSEFKQYTNVSASTIAASTTEQLYDSYLFETSSEAEGCSLTIKGGILPTDTTPIIDENGVVTNASKRFEQTFPLTYIDKYSVERVIESLKRNTELDVQINVYYNPQLHEFSFEIIDWISHDYETTFD